MAGGQDAAEGLIAAEGQFAAENQFAKADANDATKDNKANNAEANEAIDEADEANLVRKVNEIIVHHCCCWRPFSLTKYCAIFSKDKEYFCPNANNNQLEQTYVVGLDELVAFDGKVGADETAKEATAVNIFLPFSLTNILQSSQM